MPLPGNIGRGVLRLPRRATLDEDEVTVERLDELASQRPDQRRDSFAMSQPSQHKRIVVPARGEVRQGHIGIAAQYVDVLPGYVILVNQLLQHGRAPMLNKQPNDPDVTGVGALVEENFFNIGIGDHPVQALNALARGHLDPAKLGTDGFPYHAEDVGRQEITHDPNDAFKFRALTMRQLKDGRTFFHNGSFTKVRDVVEYFNAGVPQDPTAGAATTLSTRFTNPRGPESPRGLGLSRQQVDDLTDFLVNALYDPALAHYDPNSSTDTLQPNPRDLTYSKYHPELTALGARDGFLLSGLAIDDNDPLSRRDQGLEFLDVTSQLKTQTEVGLQGDDQVDVVRITNTSTSVVDTHLLAIVQGLPAGVSMENASGMTHDGKLYLRIFLPEGVLNPGQSIRRNIVLERRSYRGPVNVSLTFLSGQGQP